MLALALATLLGAAPGLDALAPDAGLGAPRPLCVSVLPPLAIEPAKGRAEALVKLKALLRPGETLACRGKQTVLVTLDAAHGRELFGDHLRVACVRGAGNALDTDHVSVTLEPDGHVPEALRGIARSLAFETDPKFELVATDVGPCPE